MRKMLNDLQKWNIAQKICGNHNVEDLITQIKNINRPSAVKFTSKIIKLQTNNPYKPLPYQVIIIDFEGSPIILVGLMINDIILTYYIEDYQHLNEFHVLILELLSIARDVPFFCFSAYEQQEILKIYTSLSEQGFDLSKYDFIKSFPIINLQKDKFESITEAVFSTDSEVRFTGDPLFRNIKVIDKLFITKRFEELIIHNRTCLLSESIILQRWVKYYNISEKNKTR